MKTVTESDRLYIQSFNDKEASGGSTTSSSSFTSSSSDESSTEFFDIDQPMDSFSDMESMTTHGTTTSNISKIPPDGQYSIVEKNSNDPVGTFSFKTKETSNAEISYSFNIGVPDQGYGYEVLNTMISYLGSLGISRVSMIVKKEDPGTMKLLMKAGFKLIEQDDIKGISEYGRRVS